MPLPVPAALKAEANYDDEALAVKPQPMEEVVIGPHLVKYAFRHNNAVFQFFRTDGGLYPSSFRGRIFKAFSSWPSSKGLDIAWVPEFDSWSVIVKGGGVTPPGPSDIDEILTQVVS